MVKTVPLLQSAPTQEEQISYAKALRLATVGWTPELRKNYFEWFLRAANYTGGASFGLFIEDIKRDAIAALSPQEKEALKEVIDRRSFVVLHQRPVPAAGENIVAADVDEPFPPLRTKPSHLSRCHLIGEMGLFPRRLAAIDRRMTHGSSAAGRTRVALLLAQTKTGWWRA